MTDEEKADFIEGGVPCSGLISADPNDPPEEAGCQDLATRFVGDSPWCDNCGPGKRWRIVLRDRPYKDTPVVGGPVVEGVEILVGEDKTPFRLIDGNTLMFTYIVKDGALHQVGLPVAKGGTK